MSNHLLAKVLGVFGGRPRSHAVVAEVEPEDTSDLDPFAIAPGRAGRGGRDDSLVGRCYRSDGELVTVLKDGTNSLVRGDRTPKPWYEPREIVLNNLARHELSKPACSSSGFWYDAEQVPPEEHFAVQNKKPPGAPRHWMQP